MNGARGSDEVHVDHARMPGPLGADFFGPYPLARGPDFENRLPTSTFLARFTPSL